MDAELLIRRTKMPVMDEFREEREAIKQKSFKERFLYFCDYYKWHVIGGVALIAIVISLIHSLATRKDWAFYGAFVNAYQTPDYNAFCEDFAGYADIDLGEYDVLLDTNIYITDSIFDPGNVDTMERLMVYIAAGDMDVMASGPTIIIITEEIAVSVTQLPIVPDKSSLCFAPKYWETIIPAPTEIPTNKTSSRFRIGEALPTAARALSPTYCPTITLSAVLYNCWAIFPISIGIANAIICFPGIPTVISIGANNFLNPDNFLSCIATS